MMLEENLAELAIITPHCVVVNNNKAIVHVKVISLVDGTLPTNIEKNVLGKVLNSSNANASIKNIKSNYVNKIIIDSLTTEDDLSNVYYSMRKDEERVSLKAYDELMSFDLEYEFEEEPSSISIFGTNIYLNNVKTCEKINGYKTEVVVDNNNTNVQNNIINYIPIIVCIILAIIAASEFVVVKRKK